MNSVHTSYSQSTYDVKQTITVSNEFRKHNKIQIKPEKYLVSSRLKPQIKNIREYDQESDELTN